MSRVLVVDDEPMIVGFVSRALSAEGFQVDGATDGARALEIARTGGYELVVLDLLLPSIDGVTVLQELMESRPSQRVLILSALSDVETKVRCLEFGASDYVSKPSPSRSSSQGSERDFGSRPRVPSSGCSACEG